MALWNCIEEWWDRRISMKHWWQEVVMINTYAVFLGYLLRGVRGLGLLVLTWSTVVLLGGFVSVLQRKDFWCLTVITLIQTARVSNFLLGEKLTDIVCFICGMVFASIVTPVRLVNSCESIPLLVPAILVAAGLWVVQLLVFVIVLCPLAVLYMLGLQVSTGLSLWRLIEHDYGNVDGTTNLKPALDVLYSLAVAQGVLFGCRFIYAYAARKMLAELVSEEYKLNKDTVLDYLYETVSGCEKDLSFARERNLVTYAMGLIRESKSRDEYLSGIGILGTLLDLEMGVSEQWMMIKLLMTRSASFIHMVQKLLETLGPRSPYNSKIRAHAARIVALVADGICLQQFPGWIHCISSLLDTCEVYSAVPLTYVRDLSLPETYERHWFLETYERDVMRSFKKKSRKKPVSESMECNSEPSDGNKDLVVQGLRILQKLAVDEDNCRVISNTQGLLSKIMAPLISDQLHREEDHDKLSRIVVEKMELMSRLMTGPGKTRSKLQREISKNSEAIISSLESILECDKCELLLKRQAVEILLDLSVDTSSIIARETSRVIFSWILLHIFLLTDDYFGKMYGSIHLMKRSSYIRNLAAQKLHAILSLQSERNATTMSEPVVIVGDLIRTVVGAENKRYRVHAVQILQHLCSFYTGDDELKKAMVHVMPKVLREIPGCGLMTKETQVVTEANNVWFSAPGTDIEEGGDSQGNDQDNTSSFQQQNGEKHEGRKMQIALLSLCQTICDRWINKDPDLARQFDEIAAKIYSKHGKPDKAFSSLVEDMRDQATLSLLKEKNSQMEEE